MNCNSRPCTAILACSATKRRCGCSILGEAEQKSASSGRMRRMTGHGKGRRLRRSPMSSRAVGARRRVTGANSRARTCTQEYAAAAKLNRKNHLRAHRKDPDWEAAVPAREFAPVTRGCPSRRRLRGARGDLFTVLFYTLTMTAAGITAEGAAKNTGLHAFRHFYASSRIDRRSCGGLELLVAAEHLTTPTDRRLQSKRGRLSGPSYRFERWSTA